MDDYRRWSSGSGLGGRLRGMVLIHRASIAEAVVSGATGVLGKKMQMWRETDQQT